jgi:hypothetical protein
MVSRLAVVAMLYLSFDVCEPFLPGVFTFEESFDVASGRQSPAHRDASKTTLAEPTRTAASDLARDDASPKPRLARVPPPHPAARLLVRLHAPTPPSPIDED